jgi:hypothetical protein
MFIDVHLCSFVVVVILLLGQPSDASDGHWSTEYLSAVFLDINPHQPQKQVSIVQGVEEWH